MNPITRDEVAIALAIFSSDPDVFTLKGKTFTLRREFYWRPKVGPEQFFAATLALLTKAGFLYSDVQYGQKHQPFRGGESVKKNSHYWMTFKLTRKTPVVHPLKAGQELISFKGETSDTEEAEGVQTGPNAIGLITDVRQENSVWIYGVTFKNGVCVFLQDDQLNGNEYDLRETTPQIMKGKQTITKHYKKLKQAENYQNRLYNRYEHVQLIRSPLSSEEGNYVWEVKNDS